MMRRRRKRRRRSRWVRMGGLWQVKEMSNMQVMYETEKEGIKRAISELKEKFTKLKVTQLKNPLLILTLSLKVDSETILKENIQLRHEQDQKNQEVPVQPHTVHHAVHISHCPYLKRSIYHSVQPHTDNI